MKVHLFSVDKSVNVPDEPITVEHASLIIMNEREKPFEIQSVNRVDTTVQGADDEDTTMSILIRDKDAEVFMVAGGPCVDIEGLIPGPMGLVREPCGVDEDGNGVTLSEQQILENVRKTIPEYITEANKIALKKEPENIKELIKALNDMLKYA